MGKAALLVIDMQEWFFSQSRPVHREMELIACINELAGAFHAKSLPVIFIRHMNESYLLENTQDWGLHPGLCLAESSLLLNKQARNTFAEQSVLSALAQHGVNKVVVAGLVTHGCVRAACEGALALGYAVTLAADGHSSFEADAADLIEEWNTKLAAAGAAVMPVREIITRLSSAGC